QMVGAGVLIRPLLGLPHAAGVMIVGAVVILIVATAGMTSTTYVQFLKGALLLIFSGILTFLILQRGLHADKTPAAKAPQSLTITAEGKRLVNGQPQGREPGQEDLRGVGHILRLPGDILTTGPLGPISFLALLRESEIALWRT